VADADIEIPTWLEPKAWSELAHDSAERQRDVRFLRLPWLPRDLLILVDAKIAIQLDEDTDIVVVFDAKTQREFGDWRPGDDRFADAKRYTEQLPSVATSAVREKRGHEVSGEL
jgi:hypothetical protein